MKTKLLLWIALGMILGNLLFGVIPVRGSTTTSVVADNDTYVYNGGADTNYDSGLDAGARVSFGNISEGARAIAYFHFPFTGKPAEYSSAVIKIYYDWCDVAFPINASLVASNTWKENIITWNTRPSTGTLVGYTILEPPSGTSVITINVTNHVTGTEGISICLESYDLNAAGSARALTQENTGDPTLGTYVPVITWTYEEGIPLWIFLLAGGVVAVVVVIVIKKQKSGRSAKLVAPKATSVPAAAPDIKEPPAPQEPSAPPQPPSPPDSPGPQQPPAL